MTLSSIDELMDQSKEAGHTTKTREFHCVKFHKSVGFNVSGCEVRLSCKSQTNTRYDAAFVSCFITTDKVQPTSFLTALWRSMRSPIIDPPPTSTLLSLSDVKAKLSDRIIVIFPEAHIPSTSPLTI